MTHSILSGAHNWEVGPCVDRLGHVTSWDINIRPREGDRGVAVIASIYSGEEAARAILAAIQASVEHPLARMVRHDEELGLYDTGEQVLPASGTLTEGGDAKQAPGASLSGAVPNGETHNG